MKERPILFSGPMVRAILDGRKSQTRRVVKLPGQWDAFEEHRLYPGEWMLWRDGESHSTILCPYGIPGDRLWVRETFSLDAPGSRTVFYRADGHEYGREGGWKPSIFMPRWASRLTLEIVNVRVERLQEIGEADAKAEGCSPDDEIENALVDPMNGRANVEWSERAGSAKESFCNLWQRIHKRPHDETTAWEENPWVWVVEFLPQRAGRAGR